MLSVSPYIVLANGWLNYSSGGLTNNDLFYFKTHTHTTTTTLKTRGDECFYHEYLLLLKPEIILYFNERVKTFLSKVKRKQWA